MSTNKTWRSGQFKALGALAAWLAVGAMTVADAQAPAASPSTPPAVAAPGNNICWDLISAGQWIAARPACEQEVRLNKNYATTINLGHTYLLEGDKETAYRWYRESLALLKSEQELKEGPLADFDLFIGKGWSTEWSGEARAWFERGYVLLANARTLNRQVVQLYGTGRYDEAQSKAKQALEILEQVLGAGHPMVGTSLNNLAELYQAIGRYEQALPLYQRALAIGEKAEGPEHPSTGRNLNNLAGLYRDMGRYEQALPLSQRALTISEKAEGLEHPSTGTRLNNLALLYQAMGRDEQALPLYQRALAISEKALGPEQPSTGVSLNNLAELYRAMGRYEQALPLLQRALAISERAVGPEHPSTGTNLNNLAGLYQHIGLYEQALPLYQRALAISEKVEGPEHPGTGRNLNNLADLYRVMGRDEQALPLLQRALLVARNAGSLELIWTAQGNLMALHSGNTDSARTLRQPALAIWYGKQAVNALQTMRGQMQGLDRELQVSFLQKNKGTYERLANLLIEAGRIAEAEQVLAMLKERQVFELTRSTGAAPSALQTSFDGIERSAPAEQRRLEAQGVRQSTELAALERQRKLAALPEADETRRQALLVAAEQWRAQHQRFLTDLAQRFAQAAGQPAAQLAEQQTTRLQSRVALDTAGAIGLHYVVTDERIGIIVATPRGSFGRFSAAPRAELNRQITALRQAMLARADTRPSAQAL